MPGVLDLSLLRSPEFAFCVVEPGSYEFWDIDGQRDTGEHRFEYALLPYTDALPMGELVRMGYAYNLPAPLQPPFAVAGDVVVTAWKAAEDGDGWILRLQEAGGEGTTRQPHLRRTARGDRHQSARTAAKRAGDAARNSARRCTAMGF